MEHPCFIKIIANILVDLLKLNNGQMGIKYPHKKFIEFSIQRLPRVPTGPSAKLELSIANKCVVVSRDI